MVNSSLEEVAAELRQTLETDLSKPFPYDDCHRVLAKAGQTDDGLIPDLDLHFSGIAGYCSYGKKLLTLPKDDLIAAHAMLEKSFFQKHPEYCPLAVWINEIKTPTLYAEINCHEEVRCKLLEIISALLSKPEAFESVAAD